MAYYFTMLSDEPAGRRYNKSEANRALKDQIGRSRGSIEFKLCNLSAACQGLGLPTIKGYRPRFNFQMSLFARTIGIDYSGAETAESSLKGLRVYQTVGDEDSTEVLPPAGPRKYWTRRGLAEWLTQELGSGVPTIVGIDHAFSFPMPFARTAYQQGSCCQ